MRNINLVRTCVCRLLSRQLIIRFARFLVSSPNFEAFLPLRHKEEPSCLRHHTHRGIRGIPLWLTRLIPIRVPMYRPGSDAHRSPPFKIL